MRASSNPTVQAEALVLVGSALLVLAGVVLAAALAELDHQRTHERETRQRHVDEVVTVEAQLGEERRRRLKLEQELAELRAATHREGGE